MFERTTLALEASTSRNGAHSVLTVNTRCTHCRLTSQVSPKGAAYVHFDPRQISSLNKFGGFLGRVASFSK